MGALIKTSFNPLRHFMWLFLIGTCFLIILPNVGHHQIFVSAEGDSDLVFENNLEESKLISHDNKHIITRRDANPHKVHHPKSSQHEVPEDWLSTTFKRIKRQWTFGNWFGSSSTTEEPTVDSRERRASGEEPDQGQGQGQGQAQDYDENEIEDDDEEEEGVEEELVPESRKTSNYWANRQSGGVDDEDGFGDESGEGSTDITTTQFPVSPGQPIYFRITMTVIEPFIEEFNDRNSPQFVDISRNLATAVDRVYDDLDGQQSATVIMIRKREVDLFSSEVTMDLGSVNNYDHGRIRNHLYRHIQNYHTLGQYKVSTDGFSFRPFEGAKPLPACLPEELPCHSGECVPASARCNGRYECRDQSDEQGCESDINEVDLRPVDGYETSTLPQSRPPPPPPYIPPRETEPPGYTEEIETTTDYRPWYDRRPAETTSQEPATETTTQRFSLFGGFPNIFGRGDSETTTSQNRPKPSRCRADDVVRCSDGVSDICADQKCDGTPDCPDGDDEWNCPSACAEGELSCDISRCIPLNKRCDGVDDCEDRTDELECESQQCRSGQFRCDNGQCIESYQRCDQRPDCRNGEDELNCPGRERCDALQQFTCGNGKCIPRSSYCDRKYDCDDQSDERNCPCKPGDFHCANGFCVPPTQKCDGIRHCQDGSDESNCTTTGPCQYYQFQCQDGTCIDQTLKCDKQPNCPDRSDEIGCTDCKKDEFRCNNGTCINIGQRCDGVADCPHSEDEESCAFCQNNEKRCGNGECVDVTKFCDGRKDCSDGSDELVCNGPESSCQENEFQCAAGFCIMGYKRCNGIRDCPSGNDEENCPLPTEPSCGVNQFKCSDGSCISSAYRCDKIPDCPDESDERYCDEPCREDQIKCADGTCIEGQKCDGIFDCLDGSDETNCAVCTLSEFRCANGNCIAEEYRCDGRRDCDDNSDELDCVSHCPGDSFRCGDGLCLDSRRRCDGYRDCRDGSDEERCYDRPGGITTSRPATCGPDQFQCADKSCISNEFRCDQFEDCRDGSDEVGCAAPTQCRSNEFDCEDGRCIPETQKCDGRRDCPSGLDELDCRTSPPKVCASGEHTCNDGTCIPRYLVCDGTKHCRDGSDEEECGLCADPDWFQCADGACIESVLRCDNYYDCRDFSDEQNCFGCQPNEFQCSNGACVPSYLRCDRRRDCPDGSDEQNCPTEAPSTDQPEIPRPTCPWGQKPCNTGNQCFPFASFCDGHYDCNDFSDEANCVSNDTSTRGCDSGFFRCENGPCIRQELRCDGKVDCPFDTSDELDCIQYFGGVPTTEFPSAGGLDIKTYPNQQSIKESVYKPGREVVFQCRDEGPLRAKVHWLRGNGQPLPLGSRDNNGRLEIPNIQLEHSGSYTCAAIGYPPSTPGSQVNVHLTVEQYTPPPTRPPTACGLHEATCSNGDCIPKQFVCDGKYDCSDGSDETRCSVHGCEPNEFRCDNKRCVLKTWRCDGEDDCNDGSDERNCATNPPGSPCRYSEFACHSGNQCIPKSFHCDHQRDCVDGSDEVGCSGVVISKPPPPMVSLTAGEIFIVTCTAVGVPTPEITWRLNWAHVPEKCTMVSVNGVGTLTCPDIQVEDQGAYSCEAINIRGSIIATPDTILVVQGPPTVCPKGTFNEEARNTNECISCFCFGHATDCRSADLFTYQLQPPFDSHKYIGVRIDPYSGVVDIRDDPLYRGSQPRISPVGRSGVHAQLASPYGDLAQPDVLPYFSMPENYHGNQLKSYGGYLKYNLQYEGYGRPLNAPDVILKGNGYTLLYAGKTHQPGREEAQTVRFFVGEWMKRTETAPEILATREEIMMALENVENILIKLQYVDGHLDTTLTNIEMDSAGIRNTGLGQAIFVEECRCPVGYTGLSCESCAPGYIRHRSGPWLGQCYREPETCQPGTYGDPSRGIPCETCPCPLTNPSNQFSRTCHLEPDGEVTCDCPPAYTGRRCQQCAAGYTGNPLIPGDSCRPGGICSTEGAESTFGDASGRCVCKQNTDGPTCNQCKPNTFHLSRDNQFGCIACFCMGITQQCTSSNWYRDTIDTVFTNSKQDFKLVESLRKEAPIDDGIRLDQNAREIIYSEFSNRRADVYYWSLPSRYLGDKLTAYGGFLRYSLRYVPMPGGQSSRNTAPDVELISENHINLLYFARDFPQANSNQSISVSLLEQHWQRADGQKADREHLLMTLADLKAVLVKATYTTNTREAALISVSLDIADERNTGRERALAVEQCVCPPGYKGLSCEDCDIGYTRAPEGLYLGLCEPCSCNGHSNECNVETGECMNCRDFTTGPNCDQCVPGYIGDPTTGRCSWGTGEPQVCQCNSAGAISNECVGGSCRCKTNVEGNLCDVCRPGTFGLNASNPEGCEECFCSGVTEQCSESNLYTEQIPTQILDQYRHGYSITDQNQRERITTDFILNVAENKIGYNIRPGNSERLYWSLPSVFTGNRIKSYGGKLEFTQHYTTADRFRSTYTPDQDVIITGNGITIYWTSPVTQLPERDNRVSVPLNTNANWQRLDYRQGPRPASREDILIVLANVNAILVRATLSSDTTSTYLSDITLDTAVEQYTGQTSARDVEICRCPPGYRGTSCELCAVGYYRDVNDLQTGPLGSCSKCTCNGNEESCNLGPDNRVECHCLPGYVGPTCQDTDGVSLELTPSRVSAPPGTRIPFVCKYRSHERLQILVVEYGVPIYRDSDVYQSCEFGARKTFYSKVNLIPTVVQCVVKNMEGYMVGMITARVYPEVNTTPPPWVTTQPPPEPPTITVTINAPAIQIVEVGTNQRIQCSASSTTSNVPIRIHWQKEGGYLAPDHQIDDGRGLLVITGIRISDAGVYICHATDGYTIVTKEVTINVDEGNRPQRPSVSVSPPSLEVYEGQSIEIHCSASGNPAPTLQWIRPNGEALNPAHSFINGVFRVPNAHRTDEGAYECIARNQIGVERSTTYIRIVASPQLLVRIIPSQFYGKEGDRFTLICHAPAGQNNIVWSRSDGRPLPYNSIRSVDNTNLTIYDAKREDSGTYTCTVTGSLGDRGSANAIVEIIAGQPNSIFPQVTVEPERLTITQGSTAEVRCHATGSPPPIIKWTRQFDSFVNAQQVGPVLRIENAQPQDRGLYVCIATNSVGMAQGSVIIEIDRREAPVVDIQPHRAQTVVAGGSLVMQCRIIAGVPSPTVHWSRPTGQPISPSIEQLSNGVLRFTSVTIAEAGEYTCTAENVAGKTTAVGHVEVHTLPVLTILPRSGTITVRKNDYVRLECKASGVPQPTVQWSRQTTSGYPGTVRTPSSDTLTSEMQNVAVYEIISVTENDQGYYICQGRNAAGATEERVSLFVEDIPKRGDITDEDGSSAHYDTTPYPPRPPVRDNEHIPSHTDKTFTAPVGTRAELRCQTRAGAGSDPLYVNWIRGDNSTLPEGSLIRDGILYIDNVQPSDAGEYRCLGVHPSGAIVFSFSAHLIVVSPPRITLNPPKQIVRPGDNAYIECAATGEQPITITWSAISRAMPESSYAADGHLQFRGIQVSDAGRYRCTAVNRAGEADAVADVVVQDFQGPTIVAEGKEQNAVIGSTLTLHCIVRGGNERPQPPVRWYREHLPLPSTSRVNGEYLQIMDIQPNDAGRYFCEVSSGEGTSGDYIDVKVEQPGSRPSSGSPELDIQASQPISHVGDTVDLYCRSNEPGVITTWSKVSGRFANNVQTSGGTLRVSSARRENAGTYRCEARGYQGVYHKDYNFEVIDSSNENVQDEQPVETKTAPQGSTVLMDCRTDLEQPVSYQWSKPGGVLPRDVDIHSRTIQVNEVRGTDAGTYVCTASNDRTSIDIPTVLIVTGIVPYFAQAPISYVALPTLPDAYIQFNFEISFKPEVQDGLLLYNGHRKNAAKSDFISLALVNGVPEFRFNLGQGVTVVRGDRPLAIGKWHTVKVSRNRKRATMYVDREGPFIGVAEGKFLGLDLTEPLYLGGVPNFRDIAPEVQVDTGFVGCISRLKIGHSHQDILRDATVKEGITTCETCSENPCHNQGVCQEALTMEGYMCICPVGFSGPTCSKRGGEACTPYACGPGRCIDTDDSFKCLCPMGRAGRRCEREIAIYEPGFANDAYIAYPTPKPQRRLKVSLKFKPKDSGDGILLYCSESEEGHGDFASLTIKDGHVEFRFDVGSEPIIVQSNRQVKPGEWLAVTASKFLNEGRLIVNGDPSITQRVIGNHKALNLHTPLYVGGVDKQRVRVNSGVGVQDGFNGCISEINVSGLDLNIIQSATDSANIEDCSTIDARDANEGSNEILPHLESPHHDNNPYDSRQTGCSSNPCRNDGQCYPLSPVEYSCNCAHGYTGRNCEVPPNLCDHLRPCQNGGTCNGTTSIYICDCPIGFTGTNCEQRADVRNEVHFNGNSYIELSNSLLNHENENENEVIAFELATNTSNGLVFWHGQRPYEDGQGQDYISLAVVDGFLEYSFELGSGPAIIFNNYIRVSDGERHRVILKRQGKWGSIEVDNDHIIEGYADGITQKMNTNGNIYLGGTPNTSLMTGGRYLHGFNGCIYGFEVQDSRTLDLGAKAVSGINVKPCSSPNDIFSMHDRTEEDFIH